MQESIVNRLGIEFLRNYDRSAPFCLLLSYNRQHHRSARCSVIGTGTIPSAPTCPTGGQTFQTVSTHTWNTNATGTGSTG